LQTISHETLAQHESKLRGRLEDRRLITGAGRYVDDLKPENQAYLGIVRSPYAHAKILRVDFSKAEVSPDFIMGIKGDDLLKENILPLMQWVEQKPANRYQLAIKKARYAGEPVAAILARNRYAVEDILEDVVVEYEELPPVTTIEEAMAKKALVYEEWGDNVAAKNEVKHGDADTAIASAAYVIETKIGIARQAGAPIEPRAVLVYYDKKKDIFEIHGTVQSANRLQNYMSTELKIPKERIHAIVEDVGGGFGSKGAQSYSENSIACILAKKTGFPVKWVSTRTEDLLESSGGRDEYCDLILACDKDGKIVGLKASIECDGGVTGTLGRMVFLTESLLPGCYKIPNLDFNGTLYATNKGTIGPVRGAGRPEAAYFIERAMDMMAKKMGIDPFELRRRNLIEPREFPYDNGSGSKYDSGNFPELLSTLEEGSDYRGLLAWKKRVNQAKNGSIAGIGISIEVEDTGSMLTESSKVVLDRQGNVKVYTGSSPHGQGLETTLAQLCSEELGVDINHVKVIYGDTALIPSGIGTFGSRSIATGGSSVVDASRKLKSVILEKFGQLTGKDPQKLVIQDGKIWDNPKTPFLTLSELMNKLEVQELSTSSDFKLNALTYASGANLCCVLLDVETGKFKITKYVAVDDCGRVVNEAIVNGQIQGGVVHGIGGSIYEQLVFDADGRLLSTNFLDYTIPTAVESPDIEIFHVETLSAITLNGAKGVGESGTMAAYPAVINALNDAIAQSGSKQEFNIPPAMPERVLSSLNSGN
jgi:aerobic carbon-monoxide dehydrogenase large subunit